MRGVELVSSTPAWPALHNRVLCPIWPRWQHHCAERTGAALCSITPLVRELPKRVSFENSFEIGLFFADEVSPRGYFWSFSPLLVVLASAIFCFPELMQKAVRDGSTELIWSHAIVMEPGRDITDAVIRSIAPSKDCSKRYRERTGA